MTAVLLCEPRGCVCSGEDVRQEVLGDGVSFLGEVSHVIIESMGTRVRQNDGKPKPCPWQAVETWASLFNFFKSFCHLLNGDCVSRLSQ